MYLCYCARIIMETNKPGIVCMLLYMHMDTNKPWIVCMHKKVRPKSIKQSLIVLRQTEHIPSKMAVYLVPTTTNLAVMITAIMFSNLMSILLYWSNSELFVVITPSVISTWPVKLRVIVVRKKKDS